MLLPVVGSLIAGGAQAATSIVGNAATNAATGNTARIKDLRRARALGQLTAEGQADVNAARGEEMALLDQSRRNTEAALAATGATSGRDIAASRQAGDQAAMAVSDRLRKRWQAAFSDEAQEFEDRKAIRRDRTVETINDVVGAMAPALNKLGNLEGLTQKGPAGEVDFKSVARIYGMDAAVAVKQLMTENPDLTNEDIMAILDSMGK